MLTDLRSRIGLAAERSWEFENGEQAHFYSIANVIYEARGDTSVMVDATKLAASTPEWLGELSIGGSDYRNTGSGRTTSLYGEVTGSHELSSGELRGLAGTTGFRAEW